MVNGSSWIPLSEGLAKSRRTAHFVMDNRGQGGGQDHRRPRAGGSGSAIPHVLTQGVEDSAAVTFGARAAMSVQRVRSLQPLRPSGSGRSCSGSTVRVVRHHHRGIEECTPVRAQPLGAWLRAHQPADPNAAEDVCLPAGEVAHTVPPPGAMAQPRHAHARVMDEVLERAVLRNDAVCSGRLRPPHVRPGLAVAALLPLDDGDAAHVAWSNGLRRTPQLAELASITQSTAGATHVA